MIGYIHWGMPYYIESRVKTPVGTVLPSLEQWPYPKPELPPGFEVGEGSGIRAKASSPVATAHAQNAEHLSEGGGWAGGLGEGKLRPPSLYIYIYIYIYIWKRLNLSGKPV
jgi:hypothetical protein